MEQVIEGEAAAQRLMNELQVHKIELELQNIELIQAAERAEIERKKYCDLYEFAPVGYLTLNESGNICEINLTCAKLLRKQRADLLQQRFSLHVTASDLPVFNQFLHRTFEQQTSEICEIHLRREGEISLPVRLETITSHAQNECRMVLTDMTEIRQAEADRSALSKIESNNTLAAGIAHDFNNLLTTILLNLELAKSHLVSGVELDSCLNEAKLSALVAADLTQQLIICATGTTPTRKLSDLATIIRQEVSLALRGSNVFVQIHQSDELLDIEVDPAQIAQVIRQLTVNAHESMAEGGSLTIHLDNKKDPPNGQVGVQVTFTDQGCGMTPATVSRIFDPYFSTKTRGTQKGMGLSLALCQTIIQNHGGSLRVESECGVGSSFYLYLPAKRTRLESKAKESSPEAHLQRKVLLMDDEEGVRKSVHAALQWLGHEVTLTDNGQSAVEAYLSAKEQGQPFDVLILDLTVSGGLGGHATLQTLLKIDPFIKAIVMSGYTHDPVLKEHTLHGFQEALTKPFNIPQLQAALTRVMQG